MFLFVNDLYINLLVMPTYAFSLFNIFWKLPFKEKSLCAEYIQN